MKVIKLLVLLAAALLSLAVAASAQDNEPEQQERPEQRRSAAPPHNPRNNVLRELGLSSEQIQQIRRLNVERRPQMDAAHLRLRTANEALDAAIYADQVNDEDVRSRIVEVQTAQGEVARLRFENELAVRRVLMPEQLVLFRELRRRFEQRRQEFQRNAEGNERRLRRHQQGKGRQPGGPQPVQHRRDL